MHGGSKRLMIGVELKTAALEEKTKMANGKEGGEEFSIEGGVFLLGGS
jgi:hypothetical protein